jgi:hypothetical protein
MPTSIKAKAFHCKTKNKPSMNASNMISLLYFVRGDGL